MTPKFKRGDSVRKIKGSQWSGLVVGEYSTALTPEGYAVESSTERGSVQIYPAAALELVNQTKWPLNVNPEMDLHAASHGLSHWSCVSVNSNERWMRKDGLEYSAFQKGYSPGGYPEELWKIDSRYSME